LRFEGHTDWSLPETDLNIQKLTGFLDRNKIPYGKELGEYGSFQIEINPPDMPGFFSFLSETLKAPVDCIHFPYPILCVNGKGEFELIEYFPNGMTIEEFAKTAWHKNSVFPKVSASTKKIGSPKAFSIHPR